MNFQQKIINLLTICRRAGKTVIGFDAVCDAVKDKKADCVMTAVDISANTFKEVSFICDKYGVEIIPLDLKKSEIGDYIGKAVAVIAVCDKGFSERFKELSQKE